MRYADFLESPAAEAAPSLRVEFKALGKDRSGARKVLDARARLHCVTESDRARVRKEAATYLADQYGATKASPPLVETSDEFVYRLLYESLRDEDNANARFFETVEECRGALSLRIANALFLAYEKFMADEFPQAITEEQIAALEEEAEKNSASGQP